MKRQRERAVLMGRDGVINRRVGRGFVQNWEQFEFLPGALEGLRVLAENGYKVLVVSKEESVGKGLLSQNELDRLTRRMLLEVALDGGKIEQVYYCMHAPSEVCHCRTPRIGLLRQAMAEHGLYAEDTSFVSDVGEDLEAAWQAGCSGILLRRDAFLRSGNPENGEREEIACDLREAAERIVNRGLVTLEEILREQMPLPDYERDGSCLFEAFWWAYAATWSGDEDQHASSG
jgi:D-glycero-D-manno-heptose 1,7-bisphosphate phosphatase